MFKDVAEFKKANKKAGQHFFSPSTMRFFNSKIESSLLGAEGLQVFITSERYDYASPKKYTIRHAMSDGRVGDDLSEFQQFDTLEQALFTAGKLVQERLNSTITI